MVVCTQVSPTDHAGRAPHAALLSPCLPLWDQGSFFAPVCDVLIRLGYRVTLFDTLSLLDARVTCVGELASRWLTELSASGPVELLGGNALGGAVVQALVRRLAPVHGTFVVSGPTRVDEALASKLAMVADAADNTTLSNALATLQRLVIPVGAAAPRAHTPTGVGDEETARRRISRGMRLLLKLDLTDEVESHPGRLLHLVGERSQLVTRANIAKANHHRAEIVPDAGMRPQWDQADKVAGHLERFVKESTRE